ncbi:hypothetical protein WJX72_010773 [[Myrmecia] bisecta]|uniref:Uncharacterized protein n=1 Tax=[Myrmecia] bisecta TaxID=41462 RepID=A0AAW1PEW5_9CHLO
MIDCSEAPQATHLFDGQPANSLAGSAQGLDKLLQAAHQQRVKQLRRIQQMRKATEQQLHLQRSYEEKQQKELLRAQVQAAERRRAAAEKALNDVLVEKRRHEAALAAQERADAVRRAAEEKLRRADGLAAALAAEKAQQQAEKKKRAENVAVRRQEIYQRGLAALEERKRALAEKERAAEANLQAATTLRQETEHHKHQHEQQREAQRRQAQERAEQDLQNRTRYFQRKQLQREHTMQRKSQEAEAVRRAHAEEMRLRQDYIRQRLSLKEQRDAAELHALNKKIKEKMNRAVLIEQQRQTLMTEMQRIRKDIARQEQWLKESFERMEHTGRFELPPELAELENSGIVPLTSRSVSSPGSVPHPKPAATRPLSARPAVAKSAPSGQTYAARHKRPQSASARPKPEPFTVEARANQSLAVLLEAEQAKEAEREAILATVTDKRERRRLGKLFSLERANASAAISTLVEHAGANPASQELDKD